MSDEIYKPDSDDEYQFTDTEPTQVYTAPKKNFLADLLAQRRIWLVTAIIIVALAVYKLISLFFGGGHTAPEKVTSPAVTEQSAIQPINNEALNQPQVEVSNINSSAFDKRLASAEQQNQEDAAQLSRLEDRFTQVETNFNQLQSQLLQMQSQLESMTNQLGSLQQQLVKAQEKQVTTKPKAAKAVKKSTTEQVTYPQYYVQAIMPGRAWLIRESDSATITVAVGDELPGYGKIVNINPLRASVITSTDYTIPYKPD